MADVPAAKEKAQRINSRQKSGEKGRTKQRAHWKLSPPCSHLVSGCLATAGNLIFPRDQAQRSLLNYVFYCLVDSNSACLKLNQLQSLTNLGPILNSPSQTLVAGFSSQKPRNFLWFLQLFSLLTLDHNLWAVIYSMLHVSQVLGDGEIMLII